MNSTLNLLGRLSNLVLISFLAGLPLEAAELSLRVVDEIAPPGGLAVVQVELTEPQPISGGQFRFTFGQSSLNQFSIQQTSLGEISAISLLHSAEVQARSTIDALGATIEFVSPDGSFGVIEDLPLLLLAIPVDSNAVPGDEMEITLDLSQSDFKAPDGSSYPVDLKAGTFTVGGFSITEMIPSSGTIPAGETLVLRGVGFEPEMDLDIENADFSSVTLVSDSELHIRLESDYQIKATDRIRLRPDDRSFEEIVYPAIFSQIFENSPPTPLDDVFRVTSGTMTQLPVTLNDSDPDGDELVILSLDPPEHGLAEISSPHLIRYTPDEGYLGPDSFVYTLADTSGLTATAQVTLRVGPPFLSFAVQRLQIPKGSTRNIELGFSRTRAATTRVLLETSPPGILEVPESMMVSNSQILRIPMRALSLGQSQLQASVGRHVASVTVEVVEGRVVQTFVSRETPRVTVENLGAEEVQFSLQAIAREFQGELLSKPVEVGPLENAQLDLGELDLRLEDFQGWLELSSTSSNVLFNFLAGSGAQILPAIQEASDFILVSLVEVRSQIFLLNRSLRPSRVRFEWWSGGEVQFTNQIMLETRETAEIWLQQLFPGLSGKEIQSGFLRIRSSAPLAAFQRHHSRETESPGVIDLPQLHSRAFLPVCIFGADWFSEVNFINTNQHPRRLLLTLLRENGNSPGEVSTNQAQLILQPGERRSIWLRDLFGWRGPASVQGTVQISDAEGVVAWGRLGKPGDTRSVMTARFSGRQARRFVLPAFNGLGERLGLESYVVNAGAESTRIRIKLVSEAGRVLEEIDFTVEQGWHSQDLSLHSLTSPTAGGFYVMESTRPVSVFLRLYDLESGQQQFLEGLETGRFEFRN